MKGGSGVYQGKRRWRFLVIGVLFLVVLSMLVPLVFLLGLYNGFHSTGHASDHRSRSSDSGPKEEQSQERVDYYRKSIPIPNLQDNIQIHLNEAGNLTSDTKLYHDDQQHSKADTPVPRDFWPPPPSDGNMNNFQTSEGTKAAESVVGVSENLKSAVGESEKSCELKYGSYCLWREAHKEDMKDSLVKTLKDQLFVARSYYPSIAKLPGQGKLTQELKQCIQELEHVFSESTTDADLRPPIRKTSERIKVAITNSKKFPVECHNVARKLGQILDMTEDEANFHTKQSAFLYQLAVQTMPRSLHCLSMKLTVEYFNDSTVHDMELSPSEKINDPTLHHYVIFSHNVLASSVVINSTVTHARDSSKLVFHVLTNGQNYFGMKMWFFRNTYKEAAIHVLNIEQLNLDYHDKAALLSTSLPVEFHVSLQSVDNPSATTLKTEYVSVFSHAHYLIPYIFQNLQKVVVLDDDVVVQKDLSELWNLNMGGKVNGALQLCSVRLGQLTSYLGDNSFEKNSCLWMSGLNVIDLARWRELDLTETYRNLEQQVTKPTDSLEASALSASLLTFHDQIYALNNTWTLSGLGHNSGLSMEIINNAAVLHYNGRMKPWLELGIPNYKYYWKSYLSQDDQFLSQCNIIQ